MKTDTPETDKHRAMLRTVAESTEFEERLERENAELKEKLIAAENDKLHLANSIAAMGQCADLDLIKCRHEIKELREKLAGMEEQLAASQMLYDMASKERDRLVKDWKTEASRCQDAILQRDTLAAENARLKDELDDWHNAAKHVEAEHPDEVHCGCVPVLRKLLTDARSERDESRNQLADIKHEVDCKTLDFERMKQKRDKWRSVADGLANWIKSGGEWGYGQEMKDYDELKAYEEAKNL